MASEFAQLLLTHAWQVTALIVVVAIANRWLSSRRPHLAHLLWLVVLIKCVTPPLWSNPGGVFCWVQPSERGASAPPDFDDSTDVSLGVLLDAADPDSEEALTTVGETVPVYLDETAAETPDPFVTDEESSMATASIDWIPAAICGVWLTCTVIALLVVGVRWLRFWSLVRASPRRESPELERQLTELSKQLGLRRNVRLIVTEGRIGPAVVGVFRATILLPAVVVDRLLEPGRSRTINPILAHELLHVRRGDLWVGLLQTVSQSLWWFHPLVWWVGRLTTRDAERCCDEAVLAEVNCDPADYARALLDVLELKQELKPVPVFPGVRPVDVTSKRLERIMSLRQGCRRRTPWWCWLVALGMAACTLPGAAFVVSADDEPPKDVQERILPAPEQNEDSTVDQATRADKPVPQFNRAHETRELFFALSGKSEEKKRLFERLVHTRSGARGARISWHNDHAVVTTTEAGHTQIQQCLSMFRSTEAKDTAIREFIDSTSRTANEILQFEISIVSGITNDPKSVAVAGNRKVRASKIVAVIESDNWQTQLDALHLVPTDGVAPKVLAAPQVSVFNGVSATVESTAIHALSLSADDDDAPPQKDDWTGWKLSLLPCIKEDGSIWVGCSWQLKTVDRFTQIAASPVAKPQRIPVLSRYDADWGGTVTEDDVVLIPGIPVSHGNGPANSTLLALKVRRIDLETAEANRSKSTSPTSAHDSKPPKQKPWDPIPPKRPVAPIANLSNPGRLNIEMGEFKLLVEYENGSKTYQETTLRSDDGASGSIRVGSPNVRLLLRRRTQNLSATARNFTLTIDSGERTVHLDGDVTLRNRDGTVRARADKLQLSLSKLPSNDKAAIRCLLEKTMIEFTNDSEEAVLRADSIELLLDADTFRVTRLEAGDVESLRVPQLNIRSKVTINGRPFGENARNWDELKSQRRRKASSEQNDWRERLNQKVSAKFEGTTLEDAMASLEKTAQVSIVLNLKDLAREGVGKDSTFDIELKDVPLSQALTSILSSLNLTWSVEGNRIVIVSDHMRRAARLIPAAYAVADLVVAVPKTVHVDASRGSGATVSNDGAAADAVHLGGATLRFNELTELITQSVEPDSWDSAGGEGTIRTNETTLSLVIRQTPQVHEEISDLLNQLRRLQDLSVGLQFELLRPSPDAVETSAFEFAFSTPPADESGNRALPGGTIPAGDRLAFRCDPERVKAMRKQSAVTRLPKVTLFNGQQCELGLATNAESSRLLIQTVISADRRALRLALSPTTAARSSDTSRLEQLPSIADGESVLLDVTDLVADGKSKGDETQTMLLVTSEIVIAEEEEELLGIDIGATGR